MPFAAEAFATLGDTVIKDGRLITRGDLADVRVMAIRSTLKVDRALIEGTPVKFVGTATIGTDHMDIPWLESEGIQWCYAPGCNANSVSEYVTAALLLLAVRHNIDLKRLTIGIVGVGNVGRLVAEKARALGMRILLNDPPRENADRLEKSNTVQWSSLEQVLSESDVITLHVPLTRTGPYATFHMADDSFFRRARKNVVFFNTCRGAVVDTDALLRAMTAGIVSRTVVDTWEGEPSIRDDLLDRVDIATPHIAGHSFEGKVIGTYMVYVSACRYLGVMPSWHFEEHLPPPLLPEVSIQSKGRADTDVLHDLVRRVYSIEEDDHALREKTGDRAKLFDHLRRHYPVRREFRYTAVSLPGAGKPLLNTACLLGFRSG